MPDGPGVMYGGDKKLIAYYDKELQALGYAVNTLQFDKNWNLLNTDSQEFSYHNIGFGYLSDPSSVMIEYVKYSRGYVRVFVIDSSISKNSIFVSDPIDVKLAERLL